MNLLLSINYKFFNIESNAFITDWISKDTSKLISGLEVYVDKNNKDEKQYLMDIAKQVTGYSWILQIHGPSIDSFDLDILLYYGELASVAKQNIKITCHPVSRHVDKSDNVVESFKLFNILSSYIKKYNLDLTLMIENLNYLNGKDRCDTNDIFPVVNFSQDVFLCWDIGHEVDNHNCSYSIHPKLIQKLKNVHIHDISLSDHYPFQFHKTDYKRSIDYLKKIEYKDNIVLEIALDYLQGDTYEEKQYSYIEQFRLIHSCF